MKKTYSWVLLIIIIFVVQGCGFAKGEKVVHKRDELISKQFEALCYERDYGTVYIEFDDRGVADEIVKYTDNLWKKLELGEMENKMEIYLVKNIKKTQQHLMPVQHLQTRARVKKEHI